MKHSLSLSSWLPIANDQDLILSVDLAWVTVELHFTLTHFVIVDEKGGNDIYTPDLHSMCVLKKPTLTIISPSKRKIPTKDSMQSDACPSESIKKKKTKKWILLWCFYVSSPFPTPFKVSHTMFYLDMSSIYFHFHMTLSYLGKCRFVR